MPDRYLYLNGLIKKVCFSLLSRQYWATFPTANLLGFNLWGRGLVTQKCTPRKTGAVLEPCWNLSLLDCKAGTICRLFCFKGKSQTKRVRNLLVRLSKEVGKQYFRVTNDFYLMELTMMKGVRDLTIHNVTIHNKRIRSGGIDLDEGW